MSITSNDFKKLSGSMIKVIAVISMLIDHTALILHHDLQFMDNVVFTFGGSGVTIYYIMRKIGRLAFPLFCFLIAEGFANTKNVKKYGVRLLLFALISEIPFDLMIGWSFVYPARQNVYFTLFLGFMMIYVFDNFRSEIGKFIIMFVIAVIAILMQADYGIFGVLLILLMHVLRDRPAVRVLLAYPLLSGGVAALAGFIPISMYNKQRGFIRSKVLKFAFYCFYPVHILLLIAIKIIIRKYL